MILLAQLEVRGNQSSKAIHQTRSRLGDGRSFARIGGVNSCHLRYPIFFIKIILNGSVGRLYRVITRWDDGHDEALR